MRRLLLMAAVLLPGSAAVPQSMAGEQTADGIRDCLKYENHTYEVCYAYLINSTAGALVPYYKFSGSGNPAREKAARFRMESRYYGQARASLVNRISGWPEGGTEVSLPKIVIVSVRSDLRTNTAVLRTRETWRVKTEGGKVLYSEMSRSHRIVMNRVEGLILHKWVVVSGV